jgi:acyl-CoA hydrolase
LKKSNKYTAFPCKNLYTDIHFRLKNGEKENGNTGGVLVNIKRREEKRREEKRREEKRREEKRRDEKRREEKRREENSLAHAKTPLKVKRR